MSSPSPSTVRLQNWYDRIQSGDTDARNELIEFYYDRFLTFIRRVLGNRDRLRNKEESTELLHEAFAGRLNDIMIRMPRPTRQAEFWDAVHAEIRWAVRDSARHYFTTKRRLVVNEGEGGTARDDPDSSPGPEHKVSSAEIWDKLLELVGEMLHPDERRVFERRLIDESGWDEIAVQLGLKKDTVKKRYFRALKKLRAELKQRGYEWLGSEI